MRLAPEGNGKGGAGGHLSLPNDLYERALATLSERPRCTYLTRDEGFHLARTAASTGAVPWLGRGRARARGRRAPATGRLVEGGSTSTLSRGDHNETLVP